MFFKKEQRELIDKLNAILGMKHRSKPYDFKDIEDVRDMIKMSIGEYIDYQKYTCILSGINENFDESLEYYDPITWMSLTDESIRGDKLAMKVCNALSKAEQNLRELSQKSEEKCRAVLILILEQHIEFQKAVWGKAYLYNDDMLDEVFENCLEIQDTYTIEESRDAFYKILDECLDTVE